MTYTKYKSHGSFLVERKARLLMDSLLLINPKGGFRVKTRTWKGKDKKKFQTQEIIKKGCKR